MLLSTLFGMFPFLEKLFADSAYQGPGFHTALASILPSLKIKIVKRSDKASGFVVLPKRWIIERSIAWLNRCRRLAKDWENLNISALMFLRLASIRFMLRKLCNLSLVRQLSHERHDVRHVGLAPNQPSSSITWKFFTDDYEKLIISKN